MAPDRGLLTRTVDGALPSLYEACHKGHSRSPWQEPAGIRPDRALAAAALADLTAAAVRAAVVAPEAELRRWFSWPWYWSGSLIEDLVTRQRLRRIDGHVTTLIAN